MDSDKGGILDQSAIDSQSERKSKADHAPTFVAKMIFFFTPFVLGQASVRFLDHGLSAEPGFSMGREASFQGFMFIGHVCRDKQLQQISRP